MDNKKERDYRRFIWTAEDNLVFLERKEPYVPSEKDKFSDMVLDAISGKRDMLTYMEISALCGTAVPEADDDDPRHRDADRLLGMIQEIVDEEKFREIKEYFDRLVPEK